MAMPSSVKTHPEFETIVRLIRSEKVPMPEIARRFGVSRAALSSFRKKLREREKPKPPPKSIKLRAEAARLYEEAKQGGNESALKRAAKVEKEAIDCEDCEDYIWSLNQPLGQNVHGFEHEPAIRAELGRLDQDIGRRLLKLTPQRKKPPRLLGLLD